MRPLSEHLPKPMLPVLGRPLLSRIIDNLHQAGIDGVVVNTHHLSKIIRDHVRRLPKGSDVRLSHEPEILGSGGGLVRAGEFLGSEDCFLYHNGDELTDLDLRAVIESYREGFPLATLTLTDREPCNNVLVSKEGEILDIAGLGRKPVPPGARSLAFTGIAVFSREILGLLPPKGFSSVMQALVGEIGRRPGCVRAFLPKKFYWSNLEDVGQYLEAHRDLLVRRVGRWPDIPDGPAFIHHQAALSPRAELSGFVSVGPNCRIEAGASLEDCVLLEGAAVPMGARHSRVVIGKDFVVKEDAGS